MQFYTEHALKWEKAVAAAKILDTDLQAPEYENAILLPLRKRKDSSVASANGYHEGGVCTEDYTFLAGLDRKYPRAECNLGCIKSYIPQEKKYRNETVIFGGIIIGFFGHTLVDSLSRLWYFAKNADTTYKFVFLMMTNQNTFCKDFFTLAGLSEDRYEIITEATQFRKVIIPDQAMYSLSSVAHPDWFLYIERIKDSIRQILPKPNSEKIYLTRTQLPIESRFEVNECYLEKFFSERGYTVVAPEKLPLSEQINIIMNASSVVTTVGTLSHMMVFADKNANCTFFLRDPSEVIRPQIIIDRIKEYACSYVEITNAILPSPHSRGVPLYWPTAYFEEYLVDSNISFTQEEIYPKELATVLNEYIRKYALNYRDPQAFKRIANCTAFDFVNSMNYALYGVKLDKKKYQKPKIVLENEQLKKENEEIRKELEQLKNSVSWKIQKPLRWFAKKLRTLKKKVKKCFKK